MLESDDLSLACAISSVVKLEFNIGEERLGGPADNDVWWIRTTKRRDLRNVVVNGLLVSQRYAEGFQDRGNADALRARKHQVGFIGGSIQTYEGDSTDIIHL